MAYRYHGNYCGPGWSAGTYQSSVESDVPATDEFDETCKLHDGVYARSGDKRLADKKFFLQNILTMDPRRQLAGLLVGIQGAIRGDQTANTQATDKYYHNEPTTMRKTQLTPTPAPLTRGPKPIMKSRASSVGQSCAAMQTTSAPVNIGVNVPSARKSPAANRGGYTVTNREYVGYINSSSSFYLRSFFSNPGLAASFPWLSNIAGNYDRYIFRKLRYTFVPSVSTATSGRIALIWNYNAADPPPTTKTGALSVAPANETAVWTPNTLDVPCTGQILYTRDGLPNNVDLKTTDMGTLYIVTDLSTGTATIGELYVEYVVELMNPHANIPPTTEIYSQGSSVTDLFPNTNTAVIGSDYVSDSATSNVIRFNASGRYAVTYSAVGTVLTGLSTFSISDGGALAGVTTAVNAVNSAATNVIGFGCWDVTVDPKTQFTSVNFVFGGTTVTKAYAIVTRIDPGMVPIFTIA